MNDGVGKLVKHIGKHVWELAATNNEAGTSNLFLANFCCCRLFFWSTPRTSELTELAVDTNKPLQSLRPTLFFFFFFWKILAATWLAKHSQLCSLCRLHSRQQSCSFLLSTDASTLASLSPCPEENVGNATLQMENYEFLTFFWARGRHLEKGRPPLKINKSDGPQILAGITTSEASG